MAAFDLILGSAAILAPTARLRARAMSGPRPTPSTCSVVAARSGSRSPPRMRPRRGGTALATGGRWRGCVAPRSPPTSCGRDRRPSTARALGRDCGSRARRTWRWRSASAGSLLAVSRGAGPAAVLKPDRLCEPQSGHLPGGHPGAGGSEGIGIVALRRLQLLLEDRNAPLSRAQVSVERGGDLVRRAQGPELREFLAGDRDQLLGLVGRPRPRSWRSFCWTCRRAVPRRAALQIASPVATNSFLVERSSGQRLTPPSVAATRQQRRSQGDRRKGTGWRSARRHRRQGSDRSTCRSKTGEESRMGAQTEGRGHTLPSGSGRHPRVIRVGTEIANAS